MATTRVAIACQGGGTHAAFTWGVLTEVLLAQQASTPDRGHKHGGERDPQRFEIASLSGTSAGALCALAAWYGLVPNDADPECGTVDKAIERLDHLWTSFGVTTPIEAFHNMVTGNMLRLHESGFPLPRTSPYTPLGDLALRSLAMLGGRPEYLGFPGLLPSLCPDFASIDWPGVAQRDVRMIVGAIEILSGNLETFDSDKTLHDLGIAPSPTGSDQYNATRWRMRRPLSLDGVAASGTLPEVLRAQVVADLPFPTGEPGELHRRSGYYWDGLYSQNPPVRDLLNVDALDRKPDEIWVVRINPQEFVPETDHIGLDDIRDRVNALAGNLSLNQELDHIVTMNEWIARYGTDHPPLTGRKQVAIRTIKMTRETAWGLHHTSKFDRDPGHLRALYDEGRAVASSWLDTWRTDSASLESYPDDARYTVPVAQV